MERNNPEEEPLNHYIALACAAISHQHYKEALRLISEGLEKSIESEKRCDIRRILTSFKGLMAVLNFNLQEAYGDDWENKIEIPEIQEKEIRCSFCGKAQGEVAQIIAGPTVYICNECIAICNEVLSEKT
jgi:hypothetical protein